MISVIVPIYNVGKFLPKCIESLIHQTYKNIEIILVNDGSSDDSLAICKKYQKIDDRIIVIDKKNAGVSSARNRGLDIAKGKYIGFVDPDDYIDVNMYSEMIESMNKYDSEIVVCGYDYLNEDYTIQRKYNEKNIEILNKKQYFSMQFDMPPTVRHGVYNKLYKKNLLKDLRFKENLHSSEDVFFNTKYMLLVNKAIFIHRPFYKNLVRQGSATHGGLKLNQLCDSFSVHEYMHNEATTLYPELKMKSMAFLLDVCLLKYNECKDKVGLNPTIEEKMKLKYMKKFIKKYALQSFFNNEIYWKTRIMYLLLK